MRIKAFIDSHLHMLGIGYYQEIVNLNKVKKIDEIIDLVKNSDRDIVVARGFNQENLEERRMPEKADLASISKPTVLYRICGHVAVVNQAMLDYLGVTESKIISGGSINYETGFFAENALKIIQDNLPKPNKEDLKRYLIKANELLISQGVTKVASDDFSSFGLPFEEVIEAINEVDEAGLLDVEITEQVNLPYNKLKEFIDKGYANKRFKNFKMGPLKILADGSLGGRTAAMNQPYSDEPGNIGLLTYSDEELQALVDLAAANMMDSVIHAIGDRAADQAINAIAKAMTKYPRKDSANAIIHAQILNEEQIELMKKYDIGAIVQPIFINSDIKIVKERLGERVDSSYLFKSMYDKISLGFSTDSPVEPVNPFYNIYCSVTRKSVDFPEYEAYNLKEAFKLEDALKAYTDNNIKYVYNKEHEDYIEVEKDIFIIDNEELKTIKVLKTFKNGQLVYQNN
jgi:predicted amidohydrolase YtcJ